MEYSYHKCSFPYKIHVARLTDDMFDWCRQYPSKGPFNRWRVNWEWPEDPVGMGQGAPVEYPAIIQIEGEDAFEAFKIAFMGEYLVAEGN